MMQNISKWKSIGDAESLEKFLDENPAYFILDTNNRERRFRVVSRDDMIGLSIDGRCLRSLGLKLHKYMMPRKHL